MARRLSQLGIGGGNPAPTVVAIGPRSAAAADAAGLGPVVEAAGTEPEAVADAVLSILVAPTGQP
ncbi:MAG: hypothetical protein AAFN30_15320 [Actinomycetota bacterium]